MAPSAAMENAAGRSARTRSSVHATGSPPGPGWFQGQVNSGSTAGMPMPRVPSAWVKVKREPMVSTGSPPAANSAATATPASTAGRCPGTGRRSRGQITSTARVTALTVVVAGSSPGSAAARWVSFSG